MKYDYILQYECDHKHLKEPKRFGKIRDAGHYFFDKLWHVHGMDRDWCYWWLGQRLNLTEEQAHFFLMNDYNVRWAIYYCRQLLNDLRRLDQDWGDDPKTPFYILVEP